jgi:hypothetical protein
MRIQVQKWGNSLASRIPKPVASRFRTSFEVTTPPGLDLEKLEALPSPSEA